MAQDIKIAGASYPDVPAVEFETPDGDPVRFVDEAEVEEDVSNALDAITAKGGTVTGAETVADLADAIETIPEKTINTFELQAYSGDPEETELSQINFTLPYPTAGTIYGYAINNVQLYPGVQDTITSFFVIGNQAYYFYANVGGVLQQTPLEYNPATGVLSANRGGHFYGTYLIVIVE